MPDHKIASLTLGQEVTFNPRWPLDTAARYRVGIVVAVEQRIAVALDGTMGKVTASVDVRERIGDRVAVSGVWRFLSGQDEGGIRQLVTTATIGGR